MKISLNTIYLSIPLEDMEAYRYFDTESLRSIRDDMVAIIPLTYFPIKVLFASPREDQEETSLEEEEKKLMATEGMKKLQSTTQSVLENPSDPGSLPKILFCIGISNVPIHPMIEHHLYRFFRRILHHNLKDKISHWDQISEPLNQSFKKLQCHITYYVGTTEYEREHKE